MFSNGLSSSAADTEGYPPLAATSCVVTEGPDCQLNYCSGDWDTWVQSDDGFYNCTKGRCPNRHEHTFDD
jgi:hypothetical protein